MPRIFVSNIASDVEVDELNRLFSRYGRVVDIVIRRRVGNLCSGYVAMSSIEEARSAAQALDGFRLSGRELLVRVVQDM